MRLDGRLAALLLSPLALLLLAGIVVPGVILFAYSFFTMEAYQIEPGFRLDWYVAALSDPLYLAMLRNSVAIALPTTVVSVLGGYAIAHYLVFVAGRDRTPMLVLVIVSTLASFLARVYAWRTLMGERGIINSLLQSAGLIDEPLGFLLFSRFAVVVAEVNMLIPLSALLFFAALSGVRSEQREAARDLGAGRWQVQRRVVLPLIGRPVLWAIALTFFFACGDYITPQLLGGPSTTTIGTAIASQISASANYPFGAALAFVLVGGFLLLVAALRAALSAGGMLPRHPGEG
jgi:spermidine/putrescine transport system permease protein